MEPQPSMMTASSSNAGNQYGASTQQSPVNQYPNHYNHS